MKKMLTLWNRELTACFLSPIAYVTLVIFVAVTGATFLAGVQNNEGTNEPVATLLFGAVITWSTALVTVVTMRSFAEEKRTRTLEMLLTAPVTDLQIVLGKYAGALSFILLCMIPAVGQVEILDVMSPGISQYTIDMGTVMGGCLILVLAMCMFTSIGILVSLLTENQIIAALLTFSLIWLILLLPSALPLARGDWRAAVSVLEHVDSWSRGILDLRAGVFYLSTTALFIFASVQILSARRWK